MAIALTNVPYVLPNSRLPPIIHSSLMAPAASSGLLGRGVEGEAEEEEPIFSLDLQPLPNTYLGFYREWRKINPGNQVRDFHDI